MDHLFLFCNSLLFYAFFRFFGRGRTSKISKIRFRQIGHILFLKFYGKCAYWDIFLDIRDIDHICEVNYRVLKCTICIIRLEYQKTFIIYINIDEISLNILTTFLIYKKVSGDIITGRKTVKA